MQRDSFTRTLIVAAVLCVVCSVVVSGAAVGLREIQEANKLKDQKKNVLMAAGLFDSSKNELSEVNSIYDKWIERELIDLQSGEPAPEDAVDQDAYDQRKAARDPELSKSVEPPAALGGIKSREKYAFVYKVKGESGDIEQVVLPVYGKGLWSTLYGFLAVASDGKTVQGITFYEHGETPGLGGEVDNPSWKQLWPGKELYSDGGDVALEVIKGRVTESTENAENKIDGLSGATITSDGVEELVQYWVGPDGFGPYLDQFRSSAEGGQGG